MTCVAYQIQHSLFIVALYNTLSVPSQWYGDIWLTHTNSNGKPLSVSEGIDHMEANYDPSSERQRITETPVCVSNQFSSVSMQNSLSYIVYITRVYSSVFKCICTHVCICVLIWMLWQLRLSSHIFTLIAQWNVHYSPPVGRNAVCLREWGTLSNYQTHVTIIHN